MVDGLLMGRADMQVVCNCSRQSTIQVMKVSFYRFHEILLAIFALHLFGPCISRCQPNEVVINEIMYAPLAGETEWIELFNPRTESIDLMGWTIEDADSTRPRVLATYSIVLKTEAYVCIVQDSSDFLTFFPHVSCPILHPTNGWPRLNNTGDRIVLRDSHGEIIDKVEYEKQWGGSRGNSLERIHPGWLSNSPKTWSSSVSTSLSTPCKQNSLHASSLAFKPSITVDPDPFETETTISYKLTVPTAIMKLHVYDIQGHLVKILIDQEPSGSTGSVLWDGRDDEGRRLRMGVYILYLEAIHAEMGVLDRVKKTVTLAKKLQR